MQCTRIRMQFFKWVLQCCVLPSVRLRSCFSISGILAYSISDISKVEKIHIFKGVSLKLIWYDCSYRSWKINNKRYSSSCKLFFLCCCSKSIWMRDYLVVTLVFFKDIKSHWQMHQTFSHSDGIEIWFIIKILVHVILL